MTTTATHTFDAAVLRRAFSDRDAGALASLYADDAVLELVDAEHPPSRPLRIQGRRDIDAYAADLFARDMTHAVQDVVSDADVVGYAVRCEYSDGTRVLCAATGRLRDGRIVRQVGVQAWDAA